MTIESSFPSEAGLGERARHSVVWNAGVVMLISAGQFALMLVLVRLLAPSTYGEYGLLMAIIGVVFVFSAQSFADYLLQVRGEEELHEQELFTACVAINLVLCLLTNLIALLLKSTPAFAHVAEPLHWLSLCLLLQPARAIRVAELKRALDWRRIRLLHLTGFLLSAMSAVTLALEGAGVYALLVSHFVVPLPVIYDLFVVRRWRPTWSWSFSAFRPALLFGLNRQVSGTLGAGRQLLQNGAVSHVLGFASLGLLGRALGLSDLVCNRLHGHALEALYPALTKLEPRSARTSRVNGLVLRVTTWFCIPAAILASELAGPIVRVVYGQQWLEVIPLMAWAFGLGAMGAINNCIYKLSLASDLRKQCIFMDGILLSGTILCVSLLLYDGLLPYLRGLFLLHSSVVAVGLVWLCRHGILSSAVIFECLFAPAFAVAVAYTAFELTIGLLPAWMSPALRTLGAILVFALTYVGILRVVFARLLTELIGYLPMGSSLRRVLALT